jgi:hypothetical protein
MFASRPARPWPWLEASISVTRSARRSSAPAGRLGGSKSKAVSRRPAAQSRALSARPVKLRRADSKKAVRSMAMPSGFAASAVTV